MHVCDFWSFIKPYTVPYSLHTFYAFEIAKNEALAVTLRYKTTMDSEVWLPCGRFQDDRAFAPVMLQPHRVSTLGTQSLRFVVPGVLPVAQLRTMVSSYEHRLARQRSAIHFPDEAPEACVTWWCSFLDAEEKRIADSCSTCVEIQSELRTIVVRRSKGMTLEKKEANAAKQRRKDQLLVELEAHDCIDREHGLRDVPPGYSSILNDILQSFSVTAAAAEKQQEGKKQQERGDILPDDPAEGFSESDSESLMKAILKAQTGSAYSEVGKANPLRIDDGEIVSKKACLSLRFRIQLMYTWGSTLFGFKRLSE